MTSSSKTKGLGFLWNKKKDETPDKSFQSMEEDDDESIFSHQDAPSVVSSAIKKFETVNAAVAGSDDKSRSSRFGMKKLTSKLLGKKPKANDEDVTESQRDEEDPVLSRLKGLHKKRNSISGGQLPPDSSIRDDEDEYLEEKFSPLAKYKNQLLREDSSDPKSPRRIPAQQRKSNSVAAIALADDSQRESIADQPKAKSFSARHFKRNEDNVDESEHTSVYESPRRQKLTVKPPSDNEASPRVSPRTSPRATQKKVADTDDVNESKRSMRRKKSSEELALNDSSSGDDLVKPTRRRKKGAEDPPGKDGESETRQIHRPKSHDPLPGHESSDDRPPLRQHASDESGILADTSGDESEIREKRSGGRRYVNKSLSSSDEEGDVRHTRRASRRDADKHRRSRSKSRHRRSSSRQISSEGVGTTGDTELQDAAKAVQDVESDTAGEEPSAYPIPGHLECARKAKPVDKDVEDSATSGDEVVKKLKRRTKDGETKKKLVKVSQASLGQDGNAPSVSPEILAALMTAQASSKDKKFVLKRSFSDDGTELYELVEAGAKQAASLSSSSKTRDGRESRASRGRRSRSRSRGPARLASGNTNSDDDEIVERRIRARTPSGRRIRNEDSEAPRTPSNRGSDDSLAAAMKPNESSMDDSERTSTTRRSTRPARRSSTKDGMRTPTRSKSVSRRAAPSSAPAAVDGRQKAILSVAQLKYENKQLAPTPRVLARSDDLTSLTVKKLPRATDADSPVSTSMGQNRVSTRKGSEEVININLSRHGSSRGVSAAQLTIPSIEQGDDKDNVHVQYEDIASVYSK